MYGFVRDLLAEKGRSVYSTHPGVTVRQAVREMNDHGVGALLVLAHGRPAGIFTERDVLRRVVDAGRDPETTTVGEVMTADLVVIDPATRIEDAMALMTHRRCRHLPVMQRGALAGLVSIGDLTRWVSRHQEVEIRNLVDYITGRA